MRQSDLEAFLKAIDAVRREHACTREKARRFLRDTGVLDEEGRLTERYAPVGRPQEGVEHEDGS